MPALLERAAEQVQSAASSAVGSVARELDDVAGAVREPLLERAQPAAAAIERIAGAGGDAVDALTGAVPRDAGSRLGDLIEALEERVVTELERRGGRYAGAF